MTWRKGAPSRNVELVLSGYVSVKRSVSAETRRVTATLKETLERIPLEVKVTPKGVKIFVDGKALAVASAKVVLVWSVSKTKHTITVSRPGYRTRAVTVTRVNAATPLNVRLVPSVPGGPKQ